MKQAVREKVVRNKQYDKKQYLGLRNREKKEEQKAMAKISKVQNRANRDDDMNYFASYYK